MEIANIKTTEYPSVNADNTCVVNDSIVVSDCSIDEETNNISGLVYFDNANKPLKAKFIANDSTWLFGKSISKANLISLSDRSLEDRQRLGSIGGHKAKENRDKKKNFNELAKAMLEQTVTEEQIKSVLGDNTSILLDNSVASVILASMIQGAVNGSFKCAEFVRDTAGYRPKDIMQVEADIMTDSDRALIDKLNQRIG